MDGLVLKARVFARGRLFFDKYISKEGMRGRRADIGATTAYVSLKDA